MHDALIAALVAGFVSLTVSGIGFFSSWLALRAKSQEIERQVRSSFMERLYQMRLDHYPKAFELTRTLTRPPKANKSFQQEDLLNIRTQLSDWINGPAGLIVSHQVIHCAYELRDCLSSNYAEGDRYSRAQLEKLVSAASALRRELRSDVSFLHLSDHSRIRDVG